jgi:hypothetical protein
MRTASVAAGAAVLSSMSVFAPALGAADPTTRCGGPEIDPGVTSGFPLAPVRQRELWALAGYAGDWNSGHAATADATLGFEWVPWVTRTQATRLGFYGGAIGGAWGEGGHAPIAGEAAMRFRWSFAMDDFFDWYLTLRGGAQVAFGGPRFALRPAAGAGLRVLRAVLLEGGYAPLVAIGDSFADGRRAENGIAISLGLDLCVVLKGLDGCKIASPPSPTPTSLACDLYLPAQKVCAQWAANALVREALCKAVASAMDADTTSTTEQFDSIDAFLRAIRDNLPAAPSDARGAIASLVTAHEGLLKELSNARTAERMAAQHNATLPAHCSYAPVAVEIRDALGCNANGKPVACAPVPECPQ